MEERSWTVLAHLLRPQGRRGEVLAELLTDFPERFEDSLAVSLAKPGFSGTAGEARAATVTGFWLPVGKNQGRVVLSLAGIDSINLAETLNGLDVLIPRSDRMELEEGAEYIDDLVGCTVYDGDVEIGVVESVDFPTTPDGGRRLDDAAPLLSVITANEDEVLIPYVQQFLVSLDVDAKRIEMKLPEGLIELNLTEPKSGEQS
ncbi:16S rRNA processing protein RimM [Granulicella tundricola MP5ACTX9]|uniref:Ribosome maturation factor RimM n=1 Tax=Granulicella tundricola (strain ATCC BAA-1859 / DSM 23138 / MP5ACTX9) TaxID=1198114 RepID=E8X2F3_GRATM|nr:16S rRNA processing protein RimM [Granulicella tundricola MP5ACTX9]